MLDDHSSRWAAAASPGGLIGLVLTILSLMVLATSILALTGTYNIGLDDTILYVVLGISSFTSFLFSYLLLSYFRIGYRLDAEKLTISWGLWSETIPYEEIESAEPASDVLGDQNSGWVPFWPGYYIGTRDTDFGKVRVISTVPSDRQTLITRSEGEMFAISPDRPLLFIEELARSHRAYMNGIPEQETVPGGAADPAELEVGATHTSGHIAEPVPDSIQSTGAQEAGPVSTAPVFGARVAADPVPAGEPVFGSVLPEIAEPYRRPEPEYVGPAIPEEPEPDTAQYPVVFGATSIQPQHGVGQEYQEFVQAGWTKEPSSIETNAAAQPELIPPKPVILPEGTPRRQVLQPITRVHRAKTETPGPGIQPVIYQDPISLAFIGAGILATVAMVTHITVQYDNIPASLTLHWNVDGMPGRVGDPQEIWVLPVIAALVLFMNVGLAWSIAQFDHFAARLMLSSTLVVHVIIWIALFTILH
jgi:hypothetical protein